MNAQKKVALGLSGGVDSATAAVILQKQGFDVHPIFMRNWHDQDNYCTSKQDESDALSVCYALGLTLDVVDFSNTYKDRVFEHMLASLEQGHTPNPDVLCNAYVKFGCLFDYAILQRGMDYLATGHYARVQHHAHHATLLQGVDPIKDQSYFLAKIPQKALQKTLFPLGNQHKHAIRAMAKTHNLPVSNKKDSTGICFIGERPFASFISQYMLDTPGIILSEHGHIIGQHRGLFYYTIGQRKGLQIGGLKHADDMPWFVVEKNTRENILVVSQNAKHPSLLSSVLTGSAPYWIHEPPHDQTSLLARIRHGQALQPCTIEHLSASNITTRFASPQRAAAPGQYIVFYEEGTSVCIGCATINNVL